MQKYCSKKSCLFNYNVHLHSGTKRYTMNWWFYIGYAYRSTVIPYVFLLYVLDKNENIINAWYWALSEKLKNLFLAIKTNLC